MAKGEGWRLNELTEEEVTIEVGSLFQNSTTRIEMSESAYKDPVEL